MTRRQGGQVADRGSSLQASRFAQPRATKPQRSPSFLGACRPPPYPTAQPPAVPAHLVVDVHAEGDASMEGASGLVGGVNVRRASALQGARLVVEHALNAAIAAGQQCGARFRLARCKAARLPPWQCGTSEGTRGADVPARARQAGPHPWLNAPAGPAPPETNTPPPPHTPTHTPDGLGQDALRVLHRRQAQLGCHVGQRDARVGQRDAAQPSADHVVAQPHNQVVCAVGTEDRGVRAGGGAAARPGVEVVMEGAAAGGREAGRRARTASWRPAGWPVTTALPKPPAWPRQAR